ncbi:hypothetical protein HAX54_047100 [Datura stramonium]|uniref:RNase H type-1 domain-containing protein n=1 Tax=Datura stramonium TaxID=4076 RepID=A0ABS8SSC4_DATST|nr:hypothetical protein [Datura stramonium]
MLVGQVKEQKRTSGATRRVRDNKARVPLAMSMHDSVGHCPRHGAIDIINGEQNTNQKLHNITEEIKQILAQANVTATHCYREANLVADALAKNAAKKEQSFYFCNYKNLPSEASSVQIKDVTFSNISGTSHTVEAVILNCSATFPCQGIKLNDINLVYNGTGGPAVSSCANAKGTPTGKELPPSCLQSSLDSLT